MDKTLEFLTLKYNDEKEVIIIQNANEYPNIASRGNDLKIIKKTIKKTKVDTIEIVNFLYIFENLLFPHNNIGPIPINNIISKRIYFKEITKNGGPTVI